MDPNQDSEQGQEPQPKAQIPEIPPSSNTYWDNLNKTQTPAYNNTEYWNPKGSETKPTPPSEPVNPPEPLSSTSTESPASTPEPSTTISSEPTQTVTPPQENTSSWNTPPTPPAKPKSSSNTLMIIMVVLVVVLLGGTGLFWFQNYQLKNQVKNKTANVEVSPSPEATPDPMADWKVYSNTAYQYAFKYPKEFKTEISAAGASSTEAPPTARSLYLYNSLMEEPYLNRYLNVEFFQVEPSLTNTWTKSEAIVDGKAATKFVDTSLKSTFDVYHIALDNKKGFIEVYVSNAPDKLSLSSQILSTFSFTSANPSPSPIAAGTCEKGFKMFEGKDYSFCYPEDMKETSASTTSVVVLDNATETLKVSTNFQGGWGGSPCLTIDPTKVAGLPSKRLSWKTERSDGTCDSTFKSFAEMINEGVFKFPYPYALELTSKKLPFENNSKFITIEQSFKVKN